MFPQSKSIITFERMENEMAWFECVLHIFVPFSVVCHGNEISSDAINSTVRLGEHRRKWLAVAERKEVRFYFTSLYLVFRLKIGNIVTLHDLRESNRHLGHDIPVKFVCSFVKLFLSFSWSGRFNKKKTTLHHRHNKMFKTNFTEL